MVGGTGATPSECRSRRQTTGQPAHRHRGTQRDRGTARRSCVDAARAWQGWQAQGHSAAVALRTRPARRKARCAGTQWALRRGENGATGGRSEGAARRRRDARPDSRGVDALAAARLCAHAGGGSRGAAARRADPAGARVGADDGRVCAHGSHAAQGLRGGEFSKLRMNRPQKMFCRLASHCSFPFNSIPVRSMDVTPHLMVTFVHISTAGNQN
ncbi:conserved hypothetical protein [Ricinus communis]|uniref:Uncharacterized protein n=1 Tax=Ricinus communis TaxID=3988 RepID=B9TDN8_RICCO|nr:conserved hypothetical protein [Ricinus communis]